VEDYEKKKRKETGKYVEKKTVAQEEIFECQYKLDRSLKLLTSEKLQGFLPILKCSKASPTITLVILPL